MKSLLLISISFLISGAAFAQLTVKPTAGAEDSYVYVKDQILFVDNYINLTKNPTETLEASIYLRGDGQLIQSETTSTNTGSGFLSVQQNTPITNMFSYYLWCSPVGNPVDAPLVPGDKNFGVLSLYESLSGTTGTNAEVVETTTGRDGSVSPLTISTRWLYTFMEPGTEAEGNYARMNSNNAAPAGFGFTMKGVGPVGTLNQLYEFRGRPNNGNYTIPVQGPDGSDARMTLTGNPYPSALDLNRVFYDPDNSALSVFYFYDEDRTVASHNYGDKPYGYGVYTPGTSQPDTTIEPGSYVNAPFYIWTAGGGSTSTGSSGNQTVNHRFAPIGQGIMFVGTGAKTDVIIKNSHRRYIIESPATHSVFHRTSNDVNRDRNTENNPEAPTNVTATAASILADPRIPQTRFHIVFDDALTREMLLTFSDQSTDGYDRGMDGLSPMGLATDAYFPVENNNERRPYVINSVKYDLEKQIPIAFKLKNATSIKIRVVEEVNKLYKQIYLFDREQDTYLNISINANKPLTLNLPAGTYDNRYFIVFRDPNNKSDTPTSELETIEVVLESVDFFQNNSAHQLEIKNPEGYTIKTASIYDMAGKLVISESNLGNNTKYNFYTGNLSDGVYLVKLITANDIVIDYKAIIRN